MKERVAAVETPDERTVRFVLKKPWPDFLTFYSSATGAGWIVPKKYVQEVGEDGFKKAPIGAGPYKFVSFTPGRGTGVRGLRRLLAQDARREAAGLQGGARGGDAAGGAEARRGRYRLLDPRRAGRGAAEDAGTDPEAGGDPGHVLALFPRPVGSQVAVARPARARRGAAGDRLQVDLRGADARLFAGHQQHHPRQFRLLLEGAGGGVRPRQGEEAAGRGRLSATASMPATITATPPTPISPRR